MNKALALLTLCSSAVFAHTLQAAQLPADITQRGYITAAIVPNYPPLEFKDPATNQLTGFDYDLGTALAKHLGIEIRWQESAFEQMLSGLTTGRSDLVLSGMTDTPERQKVVSFIDYLRSGPQFYTLESNTEVNAATDLCGKRVGASRRTNFLNEISKWSAEHCEAAGNPAVVGVGTEGSADARAQLRQGRLDAALQGSETLPYIQSMEPGTYKVVGDPLAWQFTGMAVAATNTELRDALASSLDELIENGTYEQIIDKWGLQDAKVDAVQINAGQ
ncbi:ABC transporter substrate-binding protein [Halotalea alkalilenta]|uniref:ABC transporter substrate-binding protein n=1 Tax=Halotalea alkalilenta TaxID=376489 RepID=UPI0005B8D7BF|nr:ABC transporter substrate-binding protein [Halotalea alkalilenta]